MGTKDPDNFAELISLSLGLTQEAVDNITACDAKNTKLRDIEKVPSDVACSMLGEVTVGQFLKMMDCIPINHPNDPLGKYIQKSLVKGVVTGTIAGLSSVALTGSKVVIEQCGQQAVQEVIEQCGQQAVKEVAEQCGQQAVKEVVEQCGEQAVKEVVEQCGQQAVKEVAEESMKKVVQEGSKEAAKRGAKYAFGIGIVVETMSFLTSVYWASKKLERCEIKPNEFKRHVAKRGGAALVSVAGSTSGAAIGTALIPIPFVGTFIGSVVGGVVGDNLGSFIGGKVYDNA